MGDCITIGDLAAARMAVDELVRFEAKCGRGIEDRIVRVDSPTAFQEIGRLTETQPVRLPPTFGDKFRHMYIDWQGVRFWHSVEVK